MTWAARLVAAALIAVGLAACGSGTPTTSASPSSSASSLSITIKDFAFSPQSATTKAGTPIALVNADNQAHTFTSDAPGVFDSGSIPAGGSPPSPVVVSTPGTYSYHCSFHPFMHGQLVVT